jgi:hypothetical protein
VAEEPDKLDRSTTAPIHHLKKSGSGFFGISEIVAADEAGWSATKEAHLRGEARGSKLRFVFNGRRTTEVRQPASALLALLKSLQRKGRGGRRKKETQFRAVRFLGSRKGVLIVPSIRRHLRSRELLDSHGHIGGKMHLASSGRSRAGAARQPGRIPRPALRRRDRG